MKPAVGQIVIHRDGELFERPAIITYVHSDQCVNLQVFLDGKQDAELLAKGSGTVVKASVYRENLEKLKIRDCWKFRDEEQDWDLSCDCCGAAVVNRGVLPVLPCNCLCNRYCSTCLYCEEHCECGQDQDLQPDFVAAALKRLDRLAAKEELPEVRVRTGEKGYGIGDKG